MTRLTRRHALAASAALPAAALPKLALAQGAGAGAASARGALHRTHDLGGVEVVTLLDATLPAEALGGAPHGIFGLDVDDATFERVSAEAFIPADRATFFFTPVVVRTGERVILFDTGLGQGGLPAALEDAGLAPADVTHVVITHMHPDHVGGLMTDGAPTFAEAEHVTGEAEMAFWSENPNEAVTANVLPIRDRFTLIGDGAEVAPGVTAMAAHGHTPGHMTFRVDGGDASMLVFADTANHYVWSLAHPDWEVRFDMDKDQAAETRRRVLDMLAAERMAMTGYHMPFPGSGFVEPAGDGFRWVPTSYQFMS